MIGTIYFLRIFRGNFSNILNSAHCSDAVARSGSRELRAVKIPASYDAWRPPKRRKNDSKKIIFVCSRKLVLRQIWWILEEPRLRERQNQLQRQILLQ